MANLGIKVETVLEKFYDIQQDESIKGLYEVREKEHPNGDIMWYFFSSNNATYHSSGKDCVVRDINQSNSGYIERLKAAFEKAKRKDVKIFWLVLVYGDGIGLPPNGYDWLASIELRVSLDDITASLSMRTYPVGKGRAGYVEPCCIRVDQDKYFNTTFISCKDINGEFTSKYMEEYFKLYDNRPYHDVIWNTCIDNMEIADKQYSIQEMGTILNQMYSNAEDGMKVASIHVFGIKYGEKIIKENFKVLSIIKMAGLNESYSTELQKALNVYKCLAEGTFGLTIEQSKWLENVMEFSSGYPSEFARNRIVFGAPGTGKSYKLNKEKDILLSKGGECERVTFHPSYSYANFVGTYKPISSKDKEGKDIIKYEYVPGPFMRTYVKALQNNQDKENVRPYLLLIEEINRANVAAVFGEVFQLLDRARDNASEYTIQATEDMKKYLAKELKCSETAVEILKIPDNMFIWATMNSADQGVFPIDTAFKRRWEFEYIGVDDEIKDVDINSYVIPIGNKDNRKYVKWNDLRTKINDILVSDDCKVNEDKLLGPFFMSKNMLENALKEQEKFVKAFESKVIMYLFEDVMKMRPKNIFKGHKGRMIFSELCKTFEKDGEGLFEITDIAYQELEVKE